MEYVCVNRVVNEFNRRGHFRARSAMKVAINGHDWVRCDDGLKTDDDVFEHGRSARQS